MQRPDVQLDQVIHQPVRTRIIAYLVSRGPSDQATLQTGLALTDSHLKTHLRELIENEYVSFEKGPVNGSFQRTIYRLSPLGRMRFGDYLRALSEIIHAE